MSKDKESYIDLIANSNHIINDNGEVIGFQSEVCLVQKFFQEQKKLPQHRRQKSCMIPCPCSRCNSGSL